MRTYTAAVIAMNTLGRGTTRNPLALAISVHISKYSSVWNLSEMGSGGGDESAPLLSTSSFVALISTLSVSTNPFPILSPGANGTASVIVVRVGLAIGGNDG